MNNRTPSLLKRFRGYLPIVIDVETAGFNAETDALLEVAAKTLRMDERGLLHPNECYSYHVLPFKGANLDPAALEFTGIDPYHPFRFALEEKEVLTELFAKLDTLIKQEGCQRGVLVGHNPWFDLSFISAAAKRCQFKRTPFHPFTTFDTATLSALAYGQTVLARGVIASGLKFDPKEAHSAIYDAERTAELFCRIHNKWQELGGWR